MKFLDITERKVKDSIKFFLKEIGFTIIKIPKKKSSTKIVKNKIGNFYLSMREDHQLPAFIKYPSVYSKNLPRLTVDVLKKYPNFTMIDVGANIGDTVALSRSECFFPIVCIDADDDFFELLRNNIKQFEGVTCYKQLLGEKDETIKAELSKSIETARLKSSENSSTASVQVITLDTFIDNHKEIKLPKVLKIDTDGYDMKIVRGGLNYIESVKPIIFIEYDPIFLFDQGDNGVDTLLILEGKGYEDVIFYDNVGKLIVSGKISDHLFLKQMNNYIDIKTRMPFPYYDLVIFHKDDSDIAKVFIGNEMNFFYNGKEYAK